ncbi:MAG: aspartate ammonia-lyase [Chloroflexi bacterium]|nr:aspartate ammonia-lyase [Chloroflexota bacterium]
MSDENTREMLRGTRLFEKLDDAALQIVIGLVEVVEYQARQYLFHERGPREAVMIIASGQVAITHGIGQQPLTLAIVGPGAMLGERLLLGGDTHVASAQARMPVQVLQLSKAALERLAAEHLPIYHQLVLVAAETLSERLDYSRKRLEGRQPTLPSGRYRVEHDLLGERPVPDEAYYGIQTLRAVENFPISDTPISRYPFLIRALGYIKQAAALANFDLGLLDRDIADAISAAAQEVHEGRWDDQFVVDAIQGGAGTSTNMNANEVIANRALEMLGHPRGEYDIVHPLNHVNLSQSTNDVYPTAIKIALHLAIDQLLEAMRELRDAFAAKADEFADVVKMGRTQLQDAVPMTLGQEFSTYAVMLDEDMQRLREAALLIIEINMGATAIGTGLNAHPDYAPLVCQHLRALTGIDLITAPNLVEATQDTGVFVQVSGVLKRIATKLSKTASDLRLLSSGPRAGLHEINLPAVQPGSSIMPGKVNPVIPEVVNQVAFEVIGNDITVTMAAQAGQLQLNVMEPIIAYALFNSLTHLRNACHTFAVRCVRGITANREHLRRMVENSIGIVTALNPYIGYENSTAIAKEALETGRGVYELVLERGLLTQDELDEILKPENMTRPGFGTLDIPPLDERSGLG